MFFTPSAHPIKGQVVGRLHVDVAAGASGGARARSAAHAPAIALPTPASASPASSRIRSGIFDLVVLDRSDGTASRDARSEELDLPMRLIIGGFIVIHTGD